MKSTSESKIKLIGNEKVCVHAPLHLGDSVMSIPFLRNLRLYYPKIEICLIVKKELIPLWKYQPYSEEIKACSSTPEELLKLSPWLKKKCFDASFLLATGEDVAKAHFKAVVPIRIGYDFWERGQFLTHFIRTSGSPNDPKLTRDPMVQNYLDLLQLISIKPKFLRPRLLRTKKIKSYPANRKAVGIAPGAVYGPSKRWSAESFRELAFRISEKYGKKIILLGSKEDQLQLKSVFGHSDSKYIINQVGRTNIDQLIQWISRCDLVVANDSGISHLSNALGVQTITLFGSSSPSWTGPLHPRSKVISLSLPCSPCFDRVCRFGHTRCLNEISVGQVFHAVRRFFRSK